MNEEQEEVSTEVEFKDNESPVPMKYRWMAGGVFSVWLIEKAPQPVGLYIGLGLLIMLVLSIKKYS